MDLRRSSGLAAVLRGAAGLAHARPRRILAATVAGFAICVALGGPVAGLLSAGGDDFADPGAESELVRQRIELLTGRTASPSIVALVRLDEPLPAASSRQRLGEVATTLARDRDVAAVVGGHGDHSFVSGDRRAAYLGAFLRRGADEHDVGKRLQERLAAERGVALGGSAIAGRAVGEQVGKDLARAELIAFPILFALSLWIFRGLVAALLPLFVGVLTIFGTFFGLRLVNDATPVSIYALNLAIGLGLGLAIDYSLFVVSRYREELERVGPGREALARTLASAGRTVLFSALTVAAALLSLTMFPQRFLYSMGISGALTAVIAAAVSLLALPALLALLGPRVNALSPRRWRVAALRTARGAQGRWYRLAHAVMRHALPVALATAAVMVALGLPFTRVQFTGIDASVLPTSAPARQVDDALRTEFPARRTEPITVVVRTPAAPRRYARSLATLPGVRQVASPQRLGAGEWMVDVFPSRPALDKATLELVHAIRDRPAPGPVAVTGAAARFVDQQRSLAGRLPLALLILSLTTLVILFAMTGSLVLPVKALVMNLLTISAAFGVLVLVFQDGRLEGLLHYSSQGAIESTQPLVLLAIVFGLSTDYGVFLLARIKEHHDAGAPNKEAVAVGLERTGRIVTAAALLFTIAIGAFATSSIVFIKQVGLGTAVAVLIDATIVRALLVPSLMKLLGERNWWAPRPLRQSTQPTR